MRRPPLLASAILVSLALTGVTLSSQPAPPPPAARVAFDAWLAREAMSALDARRTRVAALRTRPDVEAYQRTVRERITSQVGVLSTTDAPLNAQITRTSRRDGYRIEHLLYDSLPGVRVTALLYVPDGDGPFPAVIGTAGHADEGKASATYQHAWVSFVRRGFVVLAHDPPGQGERLEYPDGQGGSRVGIGTREHMMTGLQVLLTGRTIGAYMVQDSRRALDYLVTRPDVDARRIAIAGNSGGGTQAALLAAVEPRLAAAVVSCYMTSWRDMWDTPGPQDSEQILPGFVGSGLDFADFAIAAAPRGFLVSSAIRDFFPIAGSRAASAELTRLYEVLGEPDQLARVENDAEHGWSQPLREGAYLALGRWLGRGAADHREAPVSPEPAESLRVSSSGQVATMSGATTIRALNVDTATRLSKAHAGDNQRSLRSLLGLTRTGPHGRIAERSGDATTSAGERVLIEVEDGLRLPARLRRTSAASRGVTVLVDDRGATARDAEIEALVRDGQHVLAIDVRGSGVLGPITGSSGYAPAYQFAARAWLLGTSVVAWQVQDIHAGLAVLDQFLPPGPREVTLRARGQTGPAAILASRFNPPQALVLEDSIVSYREFVAADEHDGVTLTVVPGVLAVTDLPSELRRLATPVRLVRPRSATGAPLSDAALAGAFGGNLPDNLTVVR